MDDTPAGGSGRPDAKAAWSEAGERLSGLGERLRQHYKQQEAPAPGEQTGSEVRDAAKRLNQAVHTAFEALASASKDQAVKDDARRAGRSVADALTGTFAGISAELGKTFGGAAKGSGESDTTTEAPPRGTPTGTPPGTPAESKPDSSKPDSGAPEYGSPESPDPSI